MTFFTLSETHLTDEPGDIFKIEGYDFISKSRSSGKGGGVSAYISNRVNYLGRYDLESEEIECMWIEIKPQKSKSFLICVIYRPPDGSSYLHVNLMQIFNDMFSIATKKFNGSNCHG